MGMTIKSALEYLKDFDSYSPYQEAIDKVSAYIEQMQADYSARLKADMAAMLEELDLQLDEMKIIRPQHNMPMYQIDPYKHGVNDSKRKIQEKINALRGNDNND